MTPTARGARRTTSSASAWLTSTPPWRRPATTCDPWAIAPAAGRCHNRRSSLAPRLDRPDSQKVLRYGDDTFISLLDRRRPQDWLSQTPEGARSASPGLLESNP